MHADDYDEPRDADMSATLDRLNHATTNDAAPKRRGFKGLHCLECGHTDTVGVDLDDTSVFTCSSCDESFTAADVCGQVAAWTAVLSWCAQAPLLDVG